MYNNKPLETMESFKYLGPEVLTNHKWNECTTRSLEARKRVFHALENICKFIFSTLW